MPPIPLLAPRRQAARRWAARTCVAIALLTSPLAACSAPVERPVEASPPPRTGPRDHRPPDDHVVRPLLDRRRGILRLPRAGGARWPGHLRHRRPTAGALAQDLGHGSPYWHAGPYRSFLRADARPLQPGEIEEITFELWATSVLAPAGHRVRVAIAGADAHNFARYPKNGEVSKWEVERGARHPSHIVLPLRER